MPRWSCIAASIALIVGFGGSAAGPVAADEHEAGITTEDLTSEGVTPESLAQYLAGVGVEVSNVTYTGADRAAGKFAGGRDIIGFEDGIILSSGDIAHVIGPNEIDGITAANGQPGDPDLSELTGFWTFDAAVLEFDFVPRRDTITIDYVFGSDEYNHYVWSSFNDVFAFFVNGENCAVVPGTEEIVSINTINNGNPHGTEPNSNPHLFENNEIWTRDVEHNTEMDGFTVPLRCTAQVQAGETNRMKLAIADASDSILDSWVLLRRESLSACTEAGLDALADTPAAGAVSGTVHDSVEPVAAGIDPSLGEAVHEVNCEVVVPTEDAINGLVGGDG